MEASVDKCVRKHNTYMCVSILFHLMLWVTYVELCCSGVKRSHDEIEKDINENFGESQSKRNDIIQKWDDKTRLSVAATSKKKGIDHSQQSTLIQIEHVSSN